MNKRMIVLLAIMVFTVMMLSASIGATMAYLVGGSPMTMFAIVFCGEFVMFLLAYIATLALQWGLTGKWSWRIKL